jgi:predicted acylesterase/phospholipase RssA
MPPGFATDGVGAVEPTDVQAHIRNAGDAQAIAQLFAQWADTMAIDHIVELANLAGAMWPKPEAHTRARIEKALLQVLCERSFMSEAFRSVLLPTHDEQPVIFGSRPVADALADMPEESERVTQGFTLLFDRGAFRRLATHQAFCGRLDGDDAQAWRDHARCFLTSHDYEALHDDQPSQAWHPGYWNKPRTLVMNGGSVKGLAFLGALAELNKRVECSFDTFCGTSAGAICATGLAMGYDLLTLEAIMLRLSFESILEPKWNPLSDPVAPWERAAKSPTGLTRHVLRQGLLPIRSLTSLVFRGALYSTDALGSFIADLNQWRPRAHGRTPKTRQTSTDDTMARLPNELVVVAASTASPNTKLFDSTSDGSRKTEFVVRCSMAIPGVFQRVVEVPVVYHDGGMLDNFPMEAVQKIRPNHDVFGLYLHDSTNPGYRASDSAAGAGELLRSVKAVWLGQNEGRKLELNRTRVAELDIAPIGTLDFGLNDRDKVLLVAAGRLGVLDFLDETAHGLLLRPGEDDIAEARQQLQDEIIPQRETSRKRWRIRHFLGGIALWGVVLVMVLLLIGTIIAIYETGTKIWETFGPGAKHSPADEGTTPTATATAAATATATATATAAAATATAAAATATATATATPPTTTTLPTTTTGSGTGVVNPGDVIPEDE